MVDVKSVGADAGGWVKFHGEEIRWIPAFCLDLVNRIAPTLQALVCVSW